ncbi:MAG TPA: acetyl-CoA hydrolase/transferase C-terminal domain-containing protein [Xanthomonadales bacterium]|nr:acetyl-CoA hydrolase/transferase C-terminal domain-containing protein [Xanthomonadales bacterium]
MPLSPPQRPEPEREDDLARCIDRILARCGPHIVAAAPLGIGKPNELVNALYARVARDQSLSLTLYTALSLARPRPSAGLEARFAGPFIERHFGANYPDLAYVADARADRLPPNVRIHEFYLQSGAWLGNGPMQRDYGSINYTHVAREVAARGVNLVVQLIAERDGRLSLSSNPDVVLDLLDRLDAEGRPRPYIACCIHPDMPFLGNDAEVPSTYPDLVCRLPAPAHRLFALPQGPIVEAEFALGLHASALVRDGGSLQIGIGALSDAIVHALLLRQRDNGAYRDALGALWRGEQPAIVDKCGDTGQFVRGLYGASEMVMDGFMHLRRAGILVRRVFDDLALQRVLNDGTIGEVADGDTLSRLVEANLVPAQLDAPSLRWLEQWGLLDAGALVANGRLRLADGSEQSADLLETNARAALSARIAGRRLRNGRYLHGAFYLGTHALYDWLRSLAGEDAEGIAMTRVSHINELYGGREMLDVAQRKDARFFNTCMMQTLLGAAVSDALADGQVVSGVGGQYNFVAMAHALPDGRSVLLLRATRDAKGHACSNIVWNYGHTTIARHLRDLVVTEYGIADLRGASDEECIQRLIAIADARFVDGLAETAKAAGKLARGWTIPDRVRGNTPQALRDALRPYASRGLFPPYPFGSDFDADELRLLGALGRLKKETATKPRRVATVLKALVAGGADPRHARLHARMGLASPQGLQEKLLARLLSWALRQTEPPERS